MIKTPAISIITPVWNGLPYLKECVESVLTQKFEDWELLISDNGSTDGTLTYLESLTDPRIRVFRQENNLGIMGNLNFLFQHARAPISQILCADDYFIEPGSLQCIIDYWNDAPQTLGFVAFNHSEQTNSKSVELEQRVTPTTIPSNQATLWFFVFGNIPGNLSNVSLRTEIVAETGYFNTNVPSAGDFDFWSRAARKYAMGVQKQVITHIRRHAGAASNYMALKGETFRQKALIYESLIEQLSHSSAHSTTKLMAYFNCQITAMHYRLGIKPALRGKFDYLKNLSATRSPIVWPAWIIVTIGLPLILFNGRQRLTVLFARALLKKSHLNQRQEGTVVHRRVSPNLLGINFRKLL